MLGYRNAASIPSMSMSGMRLCGIEAAGAALAVFEPVSDDMTVARADGADRAEPTLGAAEQRGIDLQLLLAVIVRHQPRRAVPVARLDIVGPRFSGSRM